MCVCVCLCVKGYDQRGASIAWQCQPVKKSDKVAGSAETNPVFLNLAPQRLVLRAAAVVYPQNWLETQSSKFLELLNQSLYFQQLIAIKH